MRKTHILTLSLPPERYTEFLDNAKRKHMTRSEFFREVLDRYLLKEHSLKFKKQEYSSEKNLAGILKSYWDMRAHIDQKVIIVCLAIIERYNKILIGARKRKDQWVKNLSWVFPGGRIRSLDFKKQLVKEAQKETGLTIEVKNLISTRIHPDSGFKDVQIVALYFHCKAKRGREKPGGDLSELKWVKPSEVFKYFTTSTSDEVTKFLISLEYA